MRAEYEFTIASGEWEMSNWDTWTVTGRVLPERCDVMVPIREARGMSAAGRCHIRVQVIKSLIMARCTLEKDNPSVFEIADIVRSTVTAPIDYIAFRNRGAYEIVLDLCINNQTGEAEPIPIFEPTFRNSDNAGLCFDAHPDTQKLAIPWASFDVPEFRTALHDLTAAIRYPPRTFEYCRMAVEVVRSHFDPKAKSEKDRRIEGEHAMCSALRIERKAVINLDAVAARSRHGDLVISINWEMRVRALELAWELVARFAAYLERGDNGDWRLLDTLIEV